MRQTRSRAKRSIVEDSEDEEDTPKNSKQKVEYSESSSEEEIPKKSKKKKATPKNKPAAINNEDSSSESDIENYLKPAHKINLNSSIFKDIQVPSSSKQDLETIEKNIFHGIDRLSDSDSDDEQPLSTQQEETSQKVESVDSASQPEDSTPKLNFQQLQEFSKRIEEAKKHISLYEARKKTQTNNDNDVSYLLAEGEAKTSTQIESLNSSDFEDVESDSEGDWEVVQNKEIKEKGDGIPKEGVQITLDLPNNIRQKKKNSVDLLTAIKRRLNRIVKENQVYIHQVHLLCWIAHGNFLNKMLNNESCLALALSLLPSQNCYPSSRIDLPFLEKLLTWYRKNIELRIVKKKDNPPLEEDLKKQIQSRVVHSNRMFVFIFICILRALGVHCRLVLSFQAEPLKPHASQLHSLSAKTPDAKNTKKPANNKIKDEKSDTKKDVDIKHPKPEKSSSSNSKINTSTNKTPKENVKVGIKKEKDKTKNDNKKDLKKSSVSKEKDNVRPSRTKEQRSDKTKDNNSEDSKTSRVGKEKDSVRPSRTKEHRSDKTKDNKKEDLEKSSVSKEKRKIDPKREAKATENGTSSEASVSKSTKPNLSKIKERLKDKGDKKKPKKVLQTDGGFDYWPSSDESSGTEQSDLSGSEDEYQPPGPADLKLVNNAPINIAIPQLDGGNEKTSSSKKPNLRKLKTKEGESSTKSQTKEVPEKSQSKDSGRKPFTKKNSTSESPTKKPSKLSLKKLKDHPKPQGAPSPPKKVQLDVRNDIMNLLKNDFLEDRALRRSKLTKSRKHVEDSEEEEYISPSKKPKREDSDDDFEVKSKKTPKSKIKQRVVWKKQREEIDRRVFSSDSEGDSGKKTKRGNDVWAEVYLESEEKWISVDVVKGQIHCINEIYNRASHPVSYIIAWDNDNYLKDITKRYCANWNTVTRKLRCNPEWWEQSLKPFVGPKTRRDKEEDEDLAKQQLEQPLPKTITEYKNHPLYVLERHLLKFEAIYPPDALTLGFIRNEAVYSRQCVYTLHSRDIWLKHAKVVKAGEKPYKIVKARPKYDRLSNSMITDQILEIFGPWQVEDYVPPTAENGVVPRNAYGNVELFKECMLPKGTVHLQLPGLNKVAKKMNIDCASAVVGFDFHSGWSHPTYDGFVVCEEFSEQLIAAWYLEQEEAEKRALEKIEKRVYGNWRRLIKGLLIRERLKARYDFGPPPGSSQDKEAKSKQLVLKKRRIYSSSESDS